VTDQWFSAHYCAKAGNTSFKSGLGCFVSCLSFSSEVVQYRIYIHTVPGTCTSTLEAEICGHRLTKQPDDKKRRRRRNAMIRRNNITNATRRRHDDMKTTKRRNTTRSEDTKRRYEDDKCDLDDEKTIRKENASVMWCDIRLIGQARRGNGRAERDLSSPLSRVHLLKVPLAYHA
jgi:hypothetical protein